MEREEILNRLESDLRVVANNHHVEAIFENPNEYGEFKALLTGAGVPLQSDVRQLLKAYGLHHKDTMDVDCGWGIVRQLPEAYGLHHEDTMDADCSCGIININVTLSHLPKEPNDALRELCGATRTNHQ